MQILTVLEGLSHASVLYSVQYIARTPWQYLDCNADNLYRMCSNTWYISIRIKSKITMMQCTGKLVNTWTMYHYICILSGHIKGTAKYSVSSIGHQGHSNYYSDQLYCTWSAINSGINNSCSISQIKLHY